MKDLLLVFIFIGMSFGPGFRFTTNGGPQAVTKHIELANFPNPPVEILSVKLANKLLNNEEEFVPTADWTSKLEMKVKNVSDRPIRFIQIFLYAPGDTEDAEATFNTFLEFKAGNGVDPIQPGQNVKLKHVYTHGNILDSRPARLQVEEWNGKTILSTFGMAARCGLRDQMASTRNLPSQW